MPWEERLSLILTGDAEFSQRCFAFRNLTVSRTPSTRSLSQQIREALTHKADLVSITIGRRNVFAGDQREKHDSNSVMTGIAELHSRGATVLVTNRVDPPGASLTESERNQTAESNARMWTVAREKRIVVLDLWGMRELREDRMWDDDHHGLSDLGCRLLARQAAHTIGVPYAEIITP